MRWIFSTLFLALCACENWEAGVEFHYSYTIKAKIGSAPKPPTLASLKKKLPKITTKFDFGVKVQQP